MLHKPVGGSVSWRTGSSFCWLCTVTWHMLAVDEHILRGIALTDMRLSFVLQDPDGPSTPLAHVVSP